MGRKAEKEQSVALKEVELDESVQVRVRICRDTIREYAEVAHRKKKWPFPPVNLFHDGRRYWVGDGFHRCLAAEAAGMLEVTATVQAGGKREAEEFALGANTAHGLRRTRDDIRRAVLLADELWPQASNNVLADKLGISPHTVTAHRAVRDGVKVTSDGREYLKMGRTPGSKEEANEAEPWEVPTDEPEDGQWVEAGERPTVGEVEAWVEEIPTWGELAEGSGAERRRMASGADGEETEHVRRDLVVEWCRMPGDDGQPRWAGFRRQPVSIEHAQRERERMAAEAKVEGNAEWMRKLREVLVMELETNAELFAATGTVLARQALKHTTGEAVRLTARSRRMDPDGYRDEVSGDGGDLVDAVCLLLGTELHAFGPEVMESKVIGEMLEALR